MTVREPTAETDPVRRYFLLRTLVQVRYSSTAVLIQIRTILPAGIIRKIFRFKWAKKFQLYTLAFVYQFPRVSQLPPEQTISYRNFCFNKSFLSFFYKIIKNFEISCIAYLKYISIKCYTWIRFLFQDSFNFH